MSAAAAAVATEAYFISAAGLDGGGAGFIIVPFVILAEVFNVATVGNGDFNCVEGRRAVTEGT